MLKTRSFQHQKVESVKKVLPIVFFKEYITEKYALTFLKTLYIVYQPAIFLIFTIYDVSTVRWISFQRFQHSDVENVKFPLRIKNEPILQNVKKFLLKYNLFYKYILIKKYNMYKCFL